MRLGAKGLRGQEQAAPTAAAVEKRLRALAGNVRQILAAQEPSGAWITRNDRFKQTMPRGVRWDGQYEEMDRISSAVFNRNVATLCEFIELSDRQVQPRDDPSSRAPE